MARIHNMEDLGIEALVGRQVKTATVNAEKDLVLLDTDKGTLYLTWEGSCCARCYLANVGGADALQGATIESAEDAEWVDVERPGEDEWGPVIESMGTKIRTSKGYVTFETRVEHNGYYGGRIMVSDVAPMDQYHCLRYDPEHGETLPEMAALTDF